jgi:hypothetical protein
MVKLMFVLHQNIFVLEGMIDHLFYNNRFSFMNQMSGGPIHADTSGSFFGRYNVGFQFHF